MAKKVKILNEIRLTDLDGRDDLTLQLKSKNSKYEVLIKMVSTAKVEIGYVCEYEKTAKIWFALKLGELLGLGYGLDGAIQPKQARRASMGVVAVARLGAGAQLAGVELV